MSKFDKTMVGYFAEPMARSDSVPPPPGQDALRPSRPPRGIRTPSAGVPLPDFSALPEHAPSWMRRARRLVLALEQVIASEGADPAQLAAMERAWAAFELGGISDAHVARTAHLCERAFHALHDRSAVPVADAYESCARVVHMGLPSALKSKLALEQVVEAMKELRRHHDAWTAVVGATSLLLGWDARSREQAALAIRAALDERKQG